MLDESERCQCALVLITTLSFIKLVQMNKTVTMAALERAFELALIFAAGWFSLLNSPLLLRLQIGLQLLSIGLITWEHRQQINACNKQKQARLHEDQILGAMTNALMNDDRQLGLLLVSQDAYTSPPKLVR